MMESAQFRIAEAVAPPIVHARPAAFDMQIDETNELVRTWERGDWTLDEAEEYIVELTELVDECRRRFGRARVLADRRGTPDRSAAIAQRLRAANTTLFIDTDRLAIVVDSSLVKGQMRRSFTHAGSQAFLSYVAAELWLTASP